MLSSTEKKKVKPNVKYGLWVIMICHCSFIVTNVPLWWGMLIVGEAVNKWGRGYMETLNFFLSFAANPKLPPQNKVLTLKKSIGNK